VKDFPTQLTKMAKCMIYIGTYAWGECEGISFTPFTPSPRRPHPLDGSAIADTIQQLLERAVKLLDTQASLVHGFQIPR
jgi:hypothetical protein